VRGAHANTCPTCKSYYRTHAFDVGRYAGRIASLVTQLLCSPDGLSGRFVERYDAGPLAAGHNDNPVAINQRGLAYEPLRISSAELFQDIFLPDDGTVGSLETAQIAGLGQRIQSISFNRGGATWSGSAVLTQPRPK